MEDLKCEKLLESFVTRVEETNDIETEDCPVLQLLVRMLSHLKEQNTEKILNELGCMSEFEAEVCSCCDE